MLFYSDPCDYIGSKSQTVLFSLSDDNTAFEWKTLENVRNKPKDSGCVSLLDVKVARTANSVDVHDMGITLCDDRANVLLSLGCEDVDVQDVWVKAVSEAVFVLQDKARETLSGRKKHSERKKELSDRKKGREDLKAKLGLEGVGMR